MIQVVGFWAVHIHLSAPFLFNWALFGTGAWPMSGWEHTSLVSFQIVMRTTGGSQFVFTCGMLRWYVHGLYCLYDGRLPSSPECYRGTIHLPWQQARDSAKSRSQTVALPFVLDGSIRERHLQAPAPPQGVGEYLRSTQSIAP